MTRLTQMIIQEDPSVYASSYGPVDGKFGVYIGTYDESPSGCQRPRTLLTSEPIYDTPEEAQTAADEVLKRAAQPAAQEQA